MAAMTHADVPGPRGSLLLGMAGDLQRDQLGTYERVMADYGDVVRLVVGPPGLRRVLYLVTHPDGVAQVFDAGAGGYTKDTPFYEEIAAYLGDGLLTSDGRRWRQQRRVVAPLFSHRRVTGSVVVMADEAARLAARWSVAAERGVPVDLDAEMVGLTLRTVGRVLFGADVDDAVAVIRETLPILNHHVRRRGLTPLRLPRRWPSPAERRAAGARLALCHVVDRIIDQRRRAPTDGADLVSLLLAARDPDTGALLDPQQIRDQLLIFLLAGHETTSTALTFACHLLARHPVVQRRMHREVDEVLAGRDPAADDIGQLTYTRMVIKEAMRLYPPAYALGRRAPAGDRIGGYRIPPGSIILLAPWATHRRADFWPDPHRFDPDRFDTEVEGARPRYAYFPFAGGLRGCIGEHFAMTEAVTVIATLLARYALRSESSSIAVCTDITLRPAGPVRCLVTHRSVPS
jgi:cytochrome P450